MGPDLLCGNDPRLIELTDMKSKGKGYSTIHNLAVINEKTQVMN